VTPEQKTADDQAYFMAVSAYSRGDYEQARQYVKQILAVDPANADALSLRRRISAAEKTSQP
jgi:Tfp pilus assembly protein PilF